MADGIGTQEMTRLFINGIKGRLLLKQHDQRRMTAQLETGVKVANRTMSY